MKIKKYSILAPSAELLGEIVRSIKQTEGFGSVELYVQDYIVTQITTRCIKKLPAKNSIEKEINNKLLTKDYVYTKQNT